MSTLFILNRQPYDSTDVTWNALRLATKLKENKQDIRIFLMNDSVDLAREGCTPPIGYDQDLKAMLKNLGFDLGRQFSVRRYYSYIQPYRLLNRLIFPQVLVVESLLYPLDHTLFV